MTWDGTESAIYKTKAEGCELVTDSDRLLLTLLSHKNVFLLVIRTTLALNSETIVSLLYLCLCPN